MVILADRWNCVGQITISVLPRPSTTLGVGHIVKGFGQQNAVSDPGGFSSFIRPHYLNLLDTILFPGISKCNDRQKIPTSVQNGPCICLSVHVMSAHDMPCKKIPDTIYNLMHMIIVLNF